MNYFKRKSIFAISFFCIIIIALVYGFTFQVLKQIPQEYNISVGDEHILNAHFPLSFSMTVDTESIIELTKLNQKRRIQNQFELRTVDKGTAHLDLKILGFVPYRTIKVNVVPKLHLIPGGQSIGVKLNTEGVLVVGIAEIQDDNSINHNIAEANDIRIGDSLMYIDGKSINDAGHVAELVQGSDGSEMKLTFKRNGNEFTKNINPVKAAEGETYRLGLWVRDKTAGVGTLTFYDPVSYKFGALGHGITDIDTGNLVAIRDGDMMKSRVISVEQGQRGKPGEIRGVFHEMHNPIGRLEKNTAFGVYGELFSSLDSDLYNNPLPIAFQHEIQQGPAQILTTTEDNEVNIYNIEIVRLNGQSKADSKSLVIKVTDDTLLEKTGGIVQGMSGSPIIQNNKIVGAVTHVLVNDPTRGYGIYIEWMLEQTNY
ncbi:Peptidase S55, sporulation stage IV, protein B [Alkaliphilus metalliredigens QYMF]|uniref:Peptidase S55, sporulation stage IV, protein B n=1 Tax=Alkaliphilus metalliredigens (strain QYMF) TaxID=293826 RepID=A6TR47_ALKMQ|nr:SpoIVB peptidase [Alkaliphilus metalliredigens]ABR48665.1 Peptidase S55, sporulation stage IV, protein B [Alkaliphilus metalliredigens QYMF]